MDETLPPPPKKRRCFFISVFIILLIIIGIGACGYYIHTELYQLRNQMILQQNNANERMARIDLLQSKITDLAQVQKALQNRPISITYTADLHSLFLNELECADMQVNILNQPKMGLLILGNVLQQLQSLQDPKLNTLEAELMSIQKKLDALQTSDDRSFLIQKLEAFQQDIMTLPMKTTPSSMEKPKMATNVTVSGSQSTLWYEKLWHDLMSLINIRRVNTPIEALTAPEDVWIIKDNVRLLLQQAKWAVVEQQSETFTALNQQIIQYLNRYFDIDNSAVKDIIHQLNTLALPQPIKVDFSNALQLVKQP